MQAARLKQDRNSAMRNNGVHLLPVKINDVARLAFDVRARHKWHILAQRLARPSQHVTLFPSSLR